MNYKSKMLVLFAASVALFFAFIHYKIYLHVGSGIGHTGNVLEEIHIGNPWAIGPIAVFIMVMGIWFYYSNETVEDDTGDEDTKDDIHMPKEAKVVIVTSLFLLIIVMAIKAAHMWSTFRP